jgi:hypothetical protein
MSLVDGFSWTRFSQSEYGDMTCLRNAETNIMLRSWEVPEDPHLSKICRGKMNIIKENVICLRISDGR